MAGFFGVNSQTKQIELHDRDFDAKLRPETWTYFYNGLLTLLDAGDNEKHNSVGYLLGDLAHVDNKRHDAYIQKMNDMLNQVGYGWVGLLKENFLPVRFPDVDYFFEQIEQIKTTQTKLKTTNLPKEERLKIYRSDREKFLRELETSINLSVAFNYQTAEKHNLRPATEKDSTTKSK